MLNDRSCDAPFLAVFTLSLSRGKSLVGSHFCSRNPRSLMTCSRSSLLAYARSMTRYQRSWAEILSTVELSDIILLSSFFVGWGLSLSAIGPLFIKGLFHSSYTDQFTFPFSCQCATF